MCLEAAAHLNIVGDTGKASCSGAAISQGGAMEWDVSRDHSSLPDLAFVNLKVHAHANGFRNDRLQTEDSFCFSSIVQ